MGGALREEEIVPVPHNRDDVDESELTRVFTTDPCLASISLSLHTPSPFALLETGSVKTVLYAHE